jgi:hypothetical protein
MLALIASLLVAVASPVPAPTDTNPFTLTPASPPPVLQTIGRTRSRALCTGLRRSVIPALAVAKKNAESFTSARGLIFKYTVQNEGIGKDYALFRLDQTTLVQMQKNLDAFDKLLADPALVAQGSVNPEDQRLVVELKKRATLLHDVQNAQINVLSGFLETERYNRYKQPSELEASAQHALGTDVLPGAAGDQKILTDYYNYAHDPRGTNQLANAHAIDEDLGSIAAVATKSASSVDTLAMDAIHACH